MFVVLVDDVLPTTVENDNDGNISDSLDDSDADIGQFDADNEEDN